MDQKAFLSALPRDTDAALSLARRRDVALMRGRSALAIDRNRPLRHALEVRHDSFLDRRFVQLLRRHRTALVVADTAGRWPYLEDVTADFLYLRLHGDAELYVSGYTDDALSRWAGRIRHWSGGGEAPPNFRKVDDSVPRRLHGPLGRNARQLSEPYDFVPTVLHGKRV